MKLKKWRKAHDLDLAAFARLVHVSAPTISRYESGIRQPKKDVLLKIWQVTLGEVTANDFFDTPSRAA